MSTPSTETPARGTPALFETHPDRYRHWTLKLDGEIATLGMNVQEDQGLSSDYPLKLNSYDLGVDIELADAIQRLRFEHPEVKAVVVTSFQDRIFCSGANIYMLAGSPHPFKVNFCKYTNETRLGIEDASAGSGLKFLAAVNGPCAGGGYELALACDEILLIDDGSSSVALPEVPLLGVLPGTGGLTRLTDKRKIRRDRADVFCTLGEGIKGRRAVKWNLVDAIAPRSRFEEATQAQAAKLAALSDRPGGEGVVLPPLGGDVDESGTRIDWKYVTLDVDREARTAEITVKAPDSAQPTDAAGMQAAGAELWALRAFRELDLALMHLRFNELEIGTLLLKTAGDGEAVLAADAALIDDANEDHWFVREVRLHMARVLRHLDVTARSLIALIEPGSAFYGSLYEIALSADRQYMLDDPDQPNTIRVGPISDGWLRMGNGLSRLETRFLGEPELAKNALSLGAEGELEPPDAEDAGLVTYAPDDIDWEDEVRIAIEERASLSPDANTGMEQNLRFAGPETLETKIFGRLSAWQNWIFQRPNAVGERGALTSYGKAQRPEFDWRRT